MTFNTILDELIAYAKDCISGKEISCIKDFSWKTNHIKYKSKVLFMSALWLATQRHWQKAI